jgi:hypothetical protein
MVKHSVNLILAGPSEPPYIRTLKTYLPIAALVSLVVFVLVFIVSVVFLDSNTKQLNFLKNEAETLEKKISDQKNVEGIYTLTAMKLSVLAQILLSGKNFSKFLPEIDSLQGRGITIDSAVIDKQGNISFPLLASSSGVLDDFVTLLLAKDREETYSKITAGGTVREKKGDYKLSITFKASQAFMQ